ncbi:uncharacterized protein DDB_G0271670-like, partial [Rhagoletis pomonella]|uniref:uncharacterized protein DDB_G0271670-like n=1 Tax=Rhagoletis pomonella TaxID=28610 RepID=UPI00177E3350
RSSSRVAAAAATVAAAIFAAASLACAGILAGSTPTPTTNNATARAAAAAAAVDASASASASNSATATSDASTAERVNVSAATAANSINTSCSSSSSSSSKSRSGSGGSSSSSSRGGVYVTSSQQCEVAADFYAIQRTGVKHKTNLHTSSASCGKRNGGRTRSRKKCLARGRISFCTAYGSSGGSVGGSNSVCERVSNLSGEGGINVDFDWQPERYERNIDARLRVVGDATSCGTSLPGTYQNSLQEQEL